MSMGLPRPTQGTASAKTSHRVCPQSRHLNQASPTANDLAVDGPTIVKGTP